LALGKKETKRKLRPVYKRTCPGLGITKKETKRKEKKKEYVDEVWVYKRSSLHPGDTRRTRGKANRAMHTQDR
jgi:hypothetical protein